MPHPADTLAPEEVRRRIKELYDMADNARVKYNEHLGCINAKRASVRRRCIHDFGTGHFCCDCGASVFC